MLYIAYRRSGFFAHYNILVRPTQPSLSLSLSFGTYININVFIVIYILDDAHKAIIYKP